jgi:DNA topoisomerase II
MTQMSEPEVEDYDEKSYTKVTFTPDYKRFGISKMTPDMLRLLKRRVYDMSGLIRGKVYLNDKLVQIPNFK